MNKLKKPVSLLLTLLLLLSVAAVAPVSFSAGAVDEYTEGNYKYTVSNNKATITKYLGHAAKVVIPSTLGGYPVECIGYMDDEGVSLYNNSAKSRIYNTNGTYYQANARKGAFNGNDCIQSVTIPSSVKTIGFYAFRWCTNLTDVTIQNGLENIWTCAFEACNGLTELKLPESVKFVATHSFSSAGEARVLSSIRDLTLYTDSSSNFDFDDLDIVLESVTFTYGSTVIPNDLFSGSMYLSDVDIPNTVYSIGNYAFFKIGTVTGTARPDINSRFTEIDIPPSVRYIGNHAFGSCDNLGSVTLHKGLLSIGDSAFAACSSLYHIILPRTLVYLGVEAFSYCSSLTTIDIPGSVGEICEGAFRYCTELHTVVIHRGCTKIGKGAFFKDDGYTFITQSGGGEGVVDEKTLDIYIPMSVIAIEDGVMDHSIDRALHSPNYRGCELIATETWKHYYTNDVRIHAPEASTGENYYNCYRDKGEAGIAFFKTADGDNIFNDYKDEDDLDAEADGSTPLADMQAVLGIVGGSEALLSYVGEDINIELESLLDDGSTLKRIGKEAFKNLDIESIGLPNSVENIDEWAFHGCKKLGEATLNAGLKEIGNYAFQNCSKLTDINLPDSLTSIGSGAFSQCKRLTDIELPSSLNNILNGAFEYCSGLESIDIPDGVKVIGNGAFLGTALQDVQLPDSITTLAKGAFEECKNLRSINIPSNIKNLGSSMFSNCKSLATVDLSGITTIGDKAFSACKSLEDVDFSDALTSIKDSSFTDCINLEDYELPDGITSLGNAAFGGCDTLRNIELPDSITSIGAAAFENCKNLRYMELPSGITSLGDYTFSNCQNLKVIEIPDGVTSISSNAFSGCDNVTIFGYENSYAEEYAENNNIPFVAHTVSNNKATITEYNLARMSNTDVVIHSEFKGYDVTALGAELFEDCTTMMNVTLPDTLKTIGSSAFEGCTNLSSITFSDNIITIGNSAFSECSKLTRVDIPKTVQSMCASAFDSCEKLKKAYVWGRTTAVGAEAFGNCPDVTVFAYDSSPADNYAANDDVPFVPLLKTNKGDSYEDVPLTDTQSVENDGNGFGLNMNNYVNSEFLGVQIKNDNDTNDIRFVSVLNEGIVSEATKSHDVDDYGFVVAKCSKPSTASAGEDNIKTITVDNPSALAVSCKMTSNKICGDYGVYNFNTKYKYITLAINDVPDDQGFVVRSYVKMKSGRVYYANYGDSFTGCAMSYNQFKSLDRGENSVITANDWGSLNTFADE